ncbi:molecular chaperone HtpG [Flammeovirga kamogawensis]|uniref:Molecular chaperone HtpG n=1 Tax=Flammeovirga kamogawensis TaxID=373891 RepID=A0ABX8GUN5_9BACT|nr:molecular chaperone HtpG [Flammeovirga kamogawensis]MBB6460010.1 molecular chaperone HtpG [Flammeovirga kamogawensis]QWG06942.1 molecular chaperone HtpG [Flammeovirga kamogawensis]TRX68762.1 molecular chaperone HtpG [Flammeovirga kamogawensis]
MASKGSISVNTENIFPIIKKFLYSDHDIFLRELVANAVDATQKLQKLASMGEFNGELGDLTIQVDVDKEAKTISITDRGLGMTEDEVEKYINQVAFSGATEFVEKFKDVDTSTIIGKFGLGFYSAFMVADNVDVITKSFKDEPAVKWECDGSTTYEITPSDKADRGTTIVLHVNEDSEEFVDEHRLRQILDRYSKFMPIPIQVGVDKRTEKEGEGDDAKDVEIVEPHIINKNEPLWTKDPKTLTDEDYLNFYKELYPMSEEPLFWIHLNVDYPFELTGILYFPKVSEDITPHKDKIQLYSRQVFITDNVEEIMPEFLRLMHGVIDSPDIPLNVSRSYLQSDANVKKISSYVTRKVGDRLSSLFKNDRENYEKKWESIGLFVKYGMMTDDKFFDKAKKFCLFENIDGKKFTLEEYKEHIASNQVDKDGKSVFLYASDQGTQDTYIQAAKKKGYDVLKMDTMIDNHFVSNTEHKFENVTMKRIDSDTVNNLIETDEKNESVLTEDETKNLVDIFKRALNNDKLEPKVEAMTADELPVMITKPEFMRRMEEMSAMQGGMGGMFGGFPGGDTVTINGNSELVGRILKEENTDAQDKLVKHAYDLAKLSQGNLKGADLTAFINRSLDII